MERTPNQPIPHCGAKEIRARVKTMSGDRQQLESLVRELNEGNVSEARRAAWTMTHLRGDDLVWMSTHRQNLIDRAIDTADTSLRRLLLTALAHLDWPPDEVCPKLIDFALEHAADPHEATGVRSACIRLAYIQCRHYPELCAELRQVLLAIDPSRLQPAVSHTRQKILGLL